MGTSATQGSESYNLNADWGPDAGNLGLNVARFGGFSRKFPLFRRMLSALFIEIGRR
jgi:hypothetical protein